MGRGSTKVWVVGGWDGWGFFFVHGQGVFQDLTLFFLGGIFFFLGQKKFSRAEGPLLNTVPDLPEQGFRLVFGLKIWPPRAFFSPSGRRARDSLSITGRRGEGGRRRRRKKLHYSQYWQCAFVFMKTVRAPQAHGTLLLPYLLWLVKVVEAERLVKEAETVMMFVG